MLIESSTVLLFENVFATFTQKKVVKKDQAGVAPSYDKQLALSDKLMCGIA